VPAVGCDTTFNGCTRNRNVIARAAWLGAMACPWQSPATEKGFVLSWLCAKVQEIATSPPFTQGFKAPRYDVQELAVILYSTDVDE